MRQLGGNVNFEVQNASGESATTAPPSSTALFPTGVDLIMANATPALQAAAAPPPTDIPILGTSVTAYGVALDLDDFDGTVGGNISGTSDLADLEQAGGHDHRVVPRGQEGGPAVLLRRAQLQLPDRGGRRSTSPPRALPTTEFAFTDSNDRGLRRRRRPPTDSDVVYVPTDNTAASNTETIANILPPAE